MESALLLVDIATDLTGRHEADDPAIARVDYQAAVLATPVDHRNRVDEAAQPGDAERGESVVSQHRVDFR